MQRRLFTIQFIRTAEVPSSDLLDLFLSSSSIQTSSFPPLVPPTQENALHQQNPPSLASMVSNLSMEAEAVARAGKVLGLYARRELPSNTVLCEYRGLLVHPNRAQHLLLDTNYNSPASSWSLAHSIPISYPGLTSSAENTSSALDVEGTANHPGAQAKLRLIVPTQTEPTNSEMRDTQREIDSHPFIGAPGEFSVCFHARVVNDNYVTWCSRSNSSGSRSCKSQSPNAFRMQKGGKVFLVSSRGGWRCDCPFLSLLSSFLLFSFSSIVQFYNPCAQEMKYHHDFRSGSDLSPHLSPTHPFGFRDRRWGGNLRSRPIRISAGDCS